MTRPIRLDHDGTTPHDPGVVAAMLAFLERASGTPSSSHRYGTAPRQAMARVRRQVASALGCGPEEVLFTSGGSESNKHTIKCFGGARSPAGARGGDGTGGKPADEKRADGRQQDRQHPSSGRTEMEGEPGSLLLRRRPASFS